MLLQINDLQGVYNLRNYPEGIVKELQDVLVSGGLAQSDAKREGFYDLYNGNRTFFIYISPATRKAVLLASWLRVEDEVAVEEAVCYTA